MVMRGAACQPGLPGTNGFTNQAPTLADYGNNRLHRAVIFDTVLRTYAAEATLTPEETQDPATRERYYLREGARNAKRLPTDRDAWVVTSCLVRQQPVLATRLVKAEQGTELERGLVQALLIDGRECLGETRRLTIDVPNFRSYVVDAYYRWLVAVRNVASLVPADGPAIASR